MNVSTILGKHKFAIDQDLFNNLVCVIDFKKVVVVVVSANESFIKNIYNAVKRSCTDSLD